MAKKKVLIVTYYWPPSGGPGVQRVLKFVKYLPQFGWEPIVLTVKDGEYPAIDQSLAKDVAPDLKVYKTKTREYFSLFRKLSGLKKSDSLKVLASSKKKKSLKQKLFSWVRANLFVPDGRVGWRSFAVKKGLEIISEEKIDVIFTCSPPHSLQLIGLDLKQKTGLPWVADFRDPWTNPYWEHSMKRTSFATKKNAQQELEVKRNADHLITVSDGVKSKLLNNLKSKPCSVIYNGFDPDDFIGNEKKLSDKIRIKYAGHISSTQIPRNFFEAFASLSEDQKSKFEITFFGKYDSSLVQIIKELKLENHILLNGYIPHDQVINEIVNSDYLLLLIPNVDAEGILTGKIFEYLGSKNPILCLGPENCEALNLIENHHLGLCFSYKDDIRSFFEIDKNYYAKNILPDLFSRINQTQQLSIILSKLKRSFDCS